MLHQRVNGPGLGQLDAQRHVVAGRSPGSISKSTPCSSGCALQLRPGAGVEAHDVVLAAEVLDQVGDRRAGGDLAVAHDADAAAQRSARRPSGAW